MLPWLLLVAPFVSAALCLTWLRRKPELAILTSIAACSISFLVAVLLFLDTNLVPSSWHWLDIPGTPGFHVTMGWQLDALSRMMLLVVTGVGLLVHIFSAGYMAEDSNRGRYFGELSLFMFSMLGIVISDNFLMMFMFWELVGLSSYLLIGFWFQRKPAALAAKKAFLVNRIGDFGFITGIILFWTFTGTLSFSHEAIIKLVTHSPNALAALSLLLFCGCVGKSAMFPLHVWLPDAMEGPTPVSALIHAATMVAAGVYMLARIFFVLQLSPYALTIIGATGAFTAFFAALIATQQDDIKRILAYSTLSQLGYMVMAVGCVAPGAAMFHLTTHAFFKALLFLGAGSIIHALHHEQDIWKMGGLRSKMPYTFSAFSAGALALAGCPFLSGFFSKDSIIEAAHETNMGFYIVALLTAALTAFYVTRLILAVFFGAARSSSAEHPHEGSSVFLAPLFILAFFSVLAGYLGLQHYFGLAETTKASLLTPVLSIIAFLTGISGGWLMYRGKTSDPIRLPLLQNKFYIDEFYDGVLVRLQQAIANILAWIDNWILGGFIVRGSATGVTVTGELLRLFQTGNLQAYAFLFTFGTVLIIYFTLLY